MACHSRVNFIAIFKGVDSPCHDDSLLFFNIGGYFRFFTLMSSAFFIKYITIGLIPNFVDTLVFVSATIESL